MSAEQVGHWNEWDSDVWSRELFKRFFVDLDGSDSPVSCLPITKELLAEIAGVSSRESSAVEKVFLNAIGRDGRTVAGKLSSTYWKRAGGRKDYPPYLAYLAMTCLAASGEDSIREYGNFRVRLEKLLGVEYNFLLPELAPLWKLLRTWIDSRRSEGIPLRRLILPDQGSYVRIGYTLRLAFPPRKDQNTLIDLFSEASVEEDPPPILVIKIVNRHITKFKERFAEEFRRFEEGIRAHHPNVNTYPFWSAVLDAVKSERGQSETDEPLYSMILQRGSDFLNEVHFLSNRQFEKTWPGGGLRFFPSIASIGNYGFHAVQVATVKTVHEDLIDELLKGNILSKLPGGRCPLSRTISEGVLFFLENDYGLFEVITSFPKEGRIIALVREELGEEIISAFADEDNDFFRQSKYHGWLESDVFDASLLSTFSILSGSRLEEVLCLQKRLWSDRILLSGGVKVEGGYLGIPPLLPLARAVGADAMLIGELSGSGSLGELRMMILAGNSKDIFELPRGVRFDGKYLILAKKENEPIARREVVFRANADHGEYKFPDCGQLRNWLQEASGPANSVCTEDSFAFCVVGGAQQLPSEDSILKNMLSRGKPEKSREALEIPVCEPSPQTGDLMEILACLATRRRGVGEGDLLTLFQDVLGHECKACLWDIVRAWVENGFLQKLTLRGWRGSVYFPLKPHLEVYSSEGQYVAVESGLSSSLLSGALEGRFRNIGIELVVRESLSPHVPIPRMWRAQNKEVFDRVAKECDIYCATPIDPMTFSWPLSVIASQQNGKEPSNYFNQGSWNWDSGRFQVPAAKDTGRGVSIHWFHRDDAPAYYQITMEGSAIWWTYSRNYALLVAYAMKGVSLFQANFSSLERSVGAEIYLPIHIGRWLSVTSLRIPGPMNEDSQRSYGYHFRDCEGAWKFVRQFWSGTSIDLTRIDVNAGRFLREAASAARSKAITRPLPHDFRELLNGLKESATSKMLANIRLPDASMLQFIRMLENAGLRGK